MVKIFALTITALSPKSYDRDLALIKRIHKRFREHPCFRSLGIETSSTLGFEIQRKGNKHCLHVHTYFSARAQPVYDDEFKIFLKRCKAHVYIVETDDITGWVKYCIKQKETPDVVWEYNQCHQDMFQEG